MFEMGRTSEALGSLEELRSLIKEGLDVCVPQGFYLYDEPKLMMDNLLFIKPEIKRELVENGAVVEAKHIVRELRDSHFDLIKSLSEN